MFLANESREFNFSINSQGGTLSRLLLVIIRAAPLSVFRKFADG